eukprot:GHUV01020570.1.p1 GENE.GHUV01020570.1~~GHUV01020570.1.p1  ORF type:complete len:468 (+),score=134.16 GHUV01020570.1:543-1946(+)
MHHTRHTCHSHPSLLWLLCYCRVIALCSAQQVSLVGHSAGAQLCMMALLQRAKTIHEAKQTPQQNLLTTLPHQKNGSPAMPKQFVAVTGVYDIAKHYAYEKQRGVHELSTMKRAMGGFDGFAAMSPAIILGAALQRQHVANKQQSQHHRSQTVRYSTCITQQQRQQQECELPAGDFYNSFQLSGESIAHRIGFDRGSDQYSAAEAALQLQSEAGMRDIMQFPLEAAAHLPPTVLVSSCTDVTVPWYESAEMYHKLLDAGVPVKHLVYNKVGHGDFVVDWPTKFTAAAANTIDDWDPPQAAAVGSGQPNHLQRHMEELSVGAAVASNGSNSSVGARTDPTDDHHDAGGGWGTGFTTTGISTETKQAGQLGPLQAHQQRQLLLQDLPHYCRDLAVVVLGQQRINFVHRQRQPTRKSGLQGVEGVGVNASDSAVLSSVVVWGASTSSGGDAVQLESMVDAQMLVDAIELN